MAEGDPDPEVDTDLPIRTSEPMAIQSRHSLMIAEEEELLVYRYPVDMREQKQVDDLRRDLGGDPVDLPQDTGVYYLVLVETENGQQAVLIREGEVRGFVAGLAVKAGVAEKVCYYRGMLPR